ncbi:general secretion pathway protein GspK [Roseiarcus fermentans]|uniref:general secretion pathway protein GspK n=1 Tax=Roseiarcus fermentans TaxID=1473586 RepID=UPI0011BDB7DA|nr:type II secretion system protein GspK [Roseiarcus fermentans]
MANPKASRPKSEGGFILVVVLWVLAALAALASSYSVYVGADAFAAQVNDDRLRIRNAISTGVELTAYQLLAAPEKDRPPQGAFTVRLARSTIDARFVSEAARIDLNAAPKELLAGLFAAVGATPTQAAGFAERVIGWRDKSNPAQNSEAEAYKQGGVGYAPRQAPFQNVLELALVLGLPPYIVDRILPLVTIYNGHGEIDIRAAPPEVLSALPNVTPDLLQRLLAARAQSPGDGEALLGLLGSARSWANAASNPAARIDLRIRLDNGRTARAEVVILVSPDDDEPFRVLSWRDDSDGAF